MCRQVSLEMPVPNSQSTTNKMRLFSVYLFLQDALHISDGVFPSIIMSSKLHIQPQVFVRPKHDAVCAVLSSWWWSEKTASKHVQRLTEINKLRNVASCWMYSENILEMHGPMNIKPIPNFTIILPAASCTDTRGRTDRTKLMVVSCSFANAPKKQFIIFE